MSALPLKTKTMRHVVVRRPREVTQAGLINELLPDGEVVLTDLRVTRAWCLGKNTDRVVDALRAGKTDSAKTLAHEMCGVVRWMAPQLHFVDDGDD